MKAAFVLWPINQEGGLATRAASLVQVCRRAGAEANFYRLHYADHLHGTGGEIQLHTSKEGGLRVSGRDLSVTDRKLPETIRHLSGYDELVFVHPCPHLTDKQRAVKNWRRLYTDVDANKTAYFTDVYAADFYPWIEEVAPFFRAVAVNDGVATYLIENLGVRADVTPHPFSQLRILDKPSKDRERLVLWTSAWRGWKGIKRFLTAVPSIDAKVRLYGTGVELRAFRKNKPDDWPGEIMGQSLPGAVENDYKRAYAAVDLTGQSRKYQGHYNRTTLEPMLYGAVSVVLDTLPEPHSRLPLECVWAVEKDAVAEGINELLAQPERATEIRENAYSWIRRECDDAKVLQALFPDRRDLDAYVDFTLPYATAAEIRAAP